MARRGPGEQDHHVRVPDARDVDLAPVHYVPVAVAHGDGPERGRVGPGLGLRHAERLKPDLAAGYPRQVRGLLLLRAVLQERAHGVDLGVGGLGVAAGAVDLLEDHARCGEPEAHPPVLLRDERSEVARLGHRPDEPLRVLAPRVEAAPVLVRVALADLPHPLPQVLVRLGSEHDPLLLS